MDVTLVVDRYAGLSCLHRQRESRSAVRRIHTVIHSIHRATATRLMPAAAAAAAAADCTAVLARRRRRRR